jgi:hypothetical protein
MLALNSSMSTVSSGSITMSFAMVTANVFTISLALKVSVPVASV